MHLVYVANDGTWRALTWWANWPIIIGAAYGFSRVAWRVLWIVVWPLQWTPVVIREREKVARRQAARSTRRATVAPVQAKEGPDEPGPFAWWPHPRPHNPPR